MSEMNIKMREVVVKSFNSGEDVCLLMKSQSATYVPTKRELQVIARRSNLHDKNVERIAELTSLVESAYVEGFLEGLLNEPQDKSVNAKRSFGFSNSNSKLNQID